jgi:S-layer homology domain
VGRAYAGMGFGGSITEHWDGRSWQIWNVQRSGSSGSSGPGWPYDEALSGLAARTVDDVWAVGYYSDVPTSTQTVIRHWNGSAWTTEPSGTMVGALSDVAAIAADDAWAVGGDIILHWDGTSWSPSPHPSPAPGYSLDSIAAVSSTDVWAVGSFTPHSSGAPILTLAMHWDGTAWQPVDTPNPSPGGINYLVSAAAAGTGEVWAVGWHSPALYEDGIALIERWDGTSWSVMDHPAGALGSSSLNGISALSGEVWAVGAYYDELIEGDGSLAERYGVPILFADVYPANPFYPYVQCLACRGIISGYPDGTFRPGNKTTRGQISKMVSNATGFNDPPGSQTYQDVPPGSPFYDYINRLTIHVVISGYPCGQRPDEPCIPPTNRPYFRPGAEVTRGQIAKIACVGPRCVGQPIPQVFEDVPPGSPFYDYVQRLSQLGVVSGYPCGGPNEPCIPPTNRPYYRPSGSATRGQVAKIVAGYFFPGCQTPARK